MKKANGKMSDVIVNSALAHRPDRDGAEGLMIGLREIAGRGMVDVRGDAASAKFRSAVKEVLGLDLPLEPRTSVTQGGITVLWLSVDQWLVCTDTAAKAAKLAEKLRAALGKEHSLVVDVSDMRAIIRLEGDAAREVLMKGSSVDFTLPGHKAGFVRRLLFAEIAALVHIVSDDPFTADVYVFRSYADYAWKWLLATAKPASRVGLFSGE
jgi:sarcosine oxidase subunit gamma